MNKFYLVSPEVPGGIGENTKFDKEIPWQVNHLHVVFEGWMGAEIMKVSPCYFVNERCKIALENSSFTGIAGFRKIETSLSENFVEMYPGKVLPDFYMVLFDGTLLESDFAVNENNKLIISQNAYDFIQGFELTIGEILEVS